MRNEVLITLEEVGIATKYGHGEVGRFRSKAGYLIEQHEIEFLPQSLNGMAESIAVAKWAIRNVGTKHGVLVSFSPKLDLEHAGNGMHLHLCGLRRQRNTISDSKGNLTVEAKQMIGGILKLAPSLTAFGNTIPASYTRFITPKESPIHICWGTKNRLALIRIPLWWNFRKNFEEANDCRRTIEFRGPDASANSHLLMAGITVAVEYGLRNPKEAMKIAEELNANNMAKDKEHKVLPLSCAEAANSLKRDRKYYEADGVFPKRVVDRVISRLESYEDENLSERLATKPEKLEDLLWEYLHYG
jgi:glutamine synthetase